MPTQISMCDRQPREAVDKGYLKVMCSTALLAAGSMRRHLISRLTPATPTQLPADSSHPPLPDSPLEDAGIKMAVRLPKDKRSETLQAVQNSDCTLLHVEAKSPKHSKGRSSMTGLAIDVRVPDEAEAQRKALRTLQALDPDAFTFSYYLNEVQASPVSLTETPIWFPRRPVDLDQVAKNIFQVDQDSINHPSMQDKEYQDRRRMFAQLAFDYKHNQPIPLVSYTDEENRTWSTVFNRLCDLYDRHACKEFLENFKQLRDIGLYRSDRIPQLRDVSEFVRRSSGFTLRPVAGYLSARDFLSALALRVFCCTQYIRHWEKPFYTPEPDCCHELLGHVPMLADPAFAHFSQEIGLASLGASDEDVKKLATCYFFTVEFGFCMEAGQLKVYGAGLLACVDEFMFAISDKAVIREFDPALVLQQECKVTSYQDMYFYTNSFTDALEKLRDFARTLRRRQNLVYNPYTQSVECASASENGAAVVRDLLGRICLDLETVLHTVRDLNP